VPRGLLEDGGDRLVVDPLAGCAEPLGDERREQVGADDVELDLLRASPERLVLVVEDRLHHVPLRAEVDVRDLRLRLEHRAHELREVRVDVDDLLELVEDERDGPVSLVRQLARQREQPLERRLDVGRRAPGLESERDRGVLGVDRHGRRDPQPAEDRQRALARAEQRRRDAFVDRLRELLGELLARGRRHQVDLRGEDTLPPEVGDRAQDEGGLAVAARCEDHHVLPVADVRLQLSQLPLAVGERLVEGERAVAEGVLRLRHTAEYHTERYRTERDKQ
jgi:hypothetical protein